MQSIKFSQFLPVGLLSLRKILSYFSPLIQVSLALNFFATGTYQSEIALLIGVCRGTVSRVVWAVTNAILRRFQDTITFPQHTRQLKEEFFQIAQFPRTVGAIDGTHIPIQRPRVNEYPDEYINRHGVHSINVLAVCDAHSKFLFVDAAWPGRVHDSWVFLNSKLYEMFVAGSIDGLLLADSGYRLAPFLLTPYLNPNSADRIAYNIAHRKTRVRIEMAFGQIKQRFRCLRNGLRIKLERACPTLLACFVLHNLFKDIDFEDERAFKEGMGKK